MADLQDVVNAIEELAEKAEIQATTFDQLTPVDVGTNATLILAQDSTRKGFYIAHCGDSVMYIGNGSVTTSNGIPFYPGDVLSEKELPVTAALYGIVASGTEEVRIIEEK